MIPQHLQIHIGESYFQIPNGSVFDILIHFPVPFTRFFDISVAGSTLKTVSFLDFPPSQQLLLSINFFIIVFSLLAIVYGYFLTIRYLEQTVKKVSSFHYWLGYATVFLSLLFLAVVIYLFPLIFIVFIKGL